MDYSAPGSSVHGILQARTLEWVAMPSSRGFPNPGIEPASLAAPVLTVGSLLLSQQGSPHGDISTLQSEHTKASCLGDIHF